MTNSSDNNKDRPFKCCKSMQAEKCCKQTHESSPKCPCKSLPTQEIVIDIDNQPKTTDNINTEINEIVNNTQVDTDIKQETITENIDTEKSNTQNPDSNQTDIENPDTKNPFMSTTYTSPPIINNDLRDDEYEEEQLNKLDKIFASKCKLYRFDTIKKCYEERGTGKIYIVNVLKTNLYKIMMVRAKVKRLGCNHYVDPSTTLMLHEKLKNVYLWNTKNDTCESDTSLLPEQTYCVKFGEKDVADLFEMKFKYAQEYNAGRIKKETV